jgi:hypothetical protein
MNLIFKASKTVQSVARIRDKARSRLFARQADCDRHADTYAPSKSDPIATQYANPIHQIGKARVSMWSGVSALS